MTGSQEVDGSIPFGSTNYKIETDRLHEDAKWPVFCAEPETVKGLLLRDVFLSQGNST